MEILPGLHERKCPQVINDVDSPTYHDGWLVVDDQQVDRFASVSSKLRVWERVTSKVPMIKELQKIRSNFGIWCRNNHKIDTYFKFRKVKFGKNKIKEQIKVILHTHLSLLPEPPPIQSMSTMNLTSPLQTPSPFHLHSSLPPRTTPTLSFKLHRTPSFSFPSLPLQSRTTHHKPRQLTTVVAALNKLSDTALVTVPAESEEFSGKFPSNSGVYAVYDKDGQLQFVGISRNIASSVLSHQKSVPELCSGVKVTIFQLLIPSIWSPNFYQLNWIVFSVGSCHIN